MFDSNNNVFPFLRNFSDSGFDRFAERVMAENETVASTFMGENIILFVTNKRFIFLKYTNDMRGNEDFHFIHYGQIRSYIAKFPEKRLLKASIYLEISGTNTITLEFQDSSDAENICKLLAQI